MAYSERLVVHLIFENVGIDLLLEQGNIIEVSYPFKLRLDGMETKLT